MPDFPVVDTHLHLWDPGRLRYPWLTGTPALNRSFLPEDFRRACGGVRVAKLVFVQCDCVPEQGLAEAEWVAGLAPQEPRLRGIVARAALERGEAVQEEVGRLAEMPLVKGIRRLIQGESDPDFCVRPDFVRGVQLLHGYGLSFDLCLTHPQLAAAIQLVRLCPDVQFILDHVGKPGIKAGQVEPWRADIRALAALDNVCCKISGMATEADWSTWTTAQLRPYIEHVIECFGFDRVMFGGDWPVSTLATDYPRWVATLDDVLRGCTETERKKFWVANAEQFYRLQA